MTFEGHVSEYLVVATRENGTLTAHGYVTRELAHSDFRIPHTSVLIVPIVAGTSNVIIHRRGSRRIGANKWDFAGGHVSFEPAALQGPEALLRCIEKDRKSVV